MPNHLDINNLSDRELLVQIHTHTTSLAEDFSEHVKKDEHRDLNFLTPLWNDYQQRQGSDKLKKFFGVFMQFTVNCAVAVVAAYAAVKGLTR